MTPIIELRDVDAHNWRACADLEVVPEQRDFVSPVARYLCLCHFGGVWHPLAVYAGDAAARDLYRALGFVETGEIEDDELVARLSPTGR